MISVRQSSFAAARLALAAACSVGIWQAWRMAHAEFLFERDTPASVRAAIHLAPDAWPFYLRLAQLDRQHAQQLLTDAIRLNRYDAPADIEPALQYEYDGKNQQAEKLFLAASEIDKTYLPRWSLANFYLRQGNTPAFWEWAQRAAAVPAENIQPLFELCWRVSDDASLLSQNVVRKNPDLVRQFVQFLLDKGRVEDAAAQAQHLVLLGKKDRDLSLLLLVVDRLIAQKDAAAASSLWHLLIRSQWINEEVSEPANPGFVRKPLPVSLDWHIMEDRGLHSWQSGSGLETQLSGQEPEDCTIVEQILILAPGAYKVTYTYRTANIPPASGLHWQLSDAASHRLIAESPDLSSDATASSSFTAIIPKDAPLVTLRLAYKRAVGTTRAEGSLTTQSITLEAQPS